jgi:hypothetical protein
VSPEEIIDHVREDIKRWLLSQGNDASEHEVEAEVDRLLVRDLAQRLSSAMICAQLASSYYDKRFRDRAERQLWNWF